MTELIVPLILNSEKATEQYLSRGPVISPRQSTIAEEDRLRLPGSDCLYVKLYCGAGLHDELIATHILNLISALNKQSLIQSWFFVRYADPETHIRLRLFANPKVLSQKVYSKILKFGEKLVQQSLCKRFSIESYDREVERYGGTEAINLAEQLFSADSVLAAQILRLELQDVFNEDRINVCAYTIDRFLENLGLSISERLEWYRPHTNALRKKSGEEYRQRKDSLSKLFFEKLDLSLPGTETILSEWEQRNKTIGRKYRQLESRGLLTYDVATICRSIVHMHCNRLLGLDREQEALAIALAGRVVESIYARLGKPAHSAIKR